MVQIAAPSRTRIPSYASCLSAGAGETVDAINERFQTAPLEADMLSRAAQTSHADVDRWYRAADVCLVTSLHDGMNLVAQGVCRGARRRGRCAGAEQVHGSGN